MAPAIPDSWQGRLIDGRYLVERVLGRGGMGTTFLAHDVRMDRKVALKVPHTRFREDEAFTERFSREIRNLTQLSHPHIVKVLDAGSFTDETSKIDFPYAVLEYLPGGSLQDRLDARRGPVAPEEVLGWLGGVASALDFIHEKGLIHRDIKPGNVLFDDVGHAFVADFGIAKALGGVDTGLTQTGATPGSPDYMAPEAATGSAIGPSYDQYALAVVVYELLAGRLPHSGDTPLATLFQKQTRPPYPLLTAAPNVPAAAATAVMRALQRERQRRFPSCSAFAEAFQAGVRAAPAPQPARMPNPPPKPDHHTRSSPIGGHRGVWQRVLVPGGLLIALASVIAWIATDKENPASSTPARPAGVPVASGPTPPIERGPTRSQPVPAQKTSIRLHLHLPEEGAVLPTREARVRGEVEGSAKEVMVMGTRVPVFWATFESTVVLPSDGPVEILVEPSAGTEGDVLRRSVSVDTTPPQVALDPPSLGQAPTPTRRFRVRGQVEDAHPERVELLGQIVPVSGDGSFEVEVSLPEGQDILTAPLVAFDQAGHRSPETILLFRKDRAPLAGASWSEALQAATTAAAALDWPRASQQLATARSLGIPESEVGLALVEGVAKYDAPPVIVMEEPSEGATVTGTHLSIRGTLRTGRATDRLVIDGRPAALDGTQFTAEVLIAEDGPLRIVVQVLDGDILRSELTRTVQAVLRKPVAPSPWREALEAAAAAASANDWPSAARHLRQARTTGAPEAEVAESLAKGVAKYEAPPEVDLEADLRGGAGSSRVAVVRGTLRTGRPTDRLEVNGGLVPVLGGNFTCDVPMPESGPLEIIARVMDGATERAMVRRMVQAEPGFAPGARDEPSVGSEGPKVAAPDLSGDPDGDPERASGASIPMPSEHDLAALDEVNRLRMQHGVPPVRFNAKLYAAAYLHSQDQMRDGYLGHESRDPSRATLRQRMQLQGYVGRTYAEVVAKDFPDARSVVRAWMESPRHREVLLDPDLVEAAFARVDGPASRTNRWTGDFADPNRSTSPLPPTPGK